MSKALSVNLRVRVLAAVAVGLTHRQARERFGVSPASISRWRELKRNQGDARSRRWVVTGARTVLSCMPRRSSTS